MPQDQKSASALDLIRQQKTAILAQKKYLQAALVAVRDLFKLIDPIKILQLRLDQAFQEEFFQYEALVQQSKKAKRNSFKRNINDSKEIIGYH